MRSFTLHTGFSNASVHEISIAYVSLACWLYDGLELPPQPVTSNIPTKLTRNEAIRQRYQAGETLAQLAAAYGISEQRIHQIVNHRRK